MPEIGAATAKTATRMTDIRLAIVIGDHVGDPAAKTIQNGKTTKISASSISDYPTWSNDRDEA